MLDGIITDFTQNVTIAALSLLYLYVATRVVCWAFFKEKKIFQHELFTQLEANMKRSKHDQ